MRVQGYSAYDGYIPYAELAKADPDARSAVLEATRLGMTGSHNYGPKTPGMEHIPRPETPPKKGVAGAATPDSTAMKCVNCGKEKSPDGQNVKKIQRFEGAPLCWSCIWETHKHPGADPYTIWKESCDA